ncbi:MAG: hypothetical protein OEZ14_15245 [Acidimicrobiia bacterium]|nr:hypothetical protein [Acidimicrobiia bacterium]
MLQHPDERRGSVAVPHPEEPLGRCLLIPDESNLPLMYYLGRMAEASGYVVELSLAPADATVVIGFGEACRFAVAAPGVWIAPDFRRPEVAAAFAGATGPGLVVGSLDDPGWDRAAAARLREFEVLTIPGVDQRLEAAGDPVRSLEVAARVLERARALFVRLA